MKVCDPIHGYIHFNEQERCLIENSFFQRLRWIQQLGFVYYAFPTGVSNRYVHSLGASDLAGRVFDSVVSKNTLKLGENRKRQFKKMLKFAALLHDIGHGPLSHTSEVFMPPLKDLKISFIHSLRKKASHEDYVIKIISESSLAKQIENFGIDLLPLMQLIHSEVKGGEDYFRVDGIDYLPFLRQIINSDLDVDRMDYLQRDSYFCGVRYGLFDFDWIISHFDAHIEKDSAYLALHNEALLTAENFLLSRYYMHSTVYFHHKPVIYEQMLKRALKNWILPLEVEDYKKITDGTVFNKLKEDPHNEWSRRILNHEPYKRLYESQEKENKSENIKRSLKENNINFIETDYLKDALNPLKDETNKISIFIKNVYSKKTSLLSERTKSLNACVQKTHRIYVPPEHFEKAKKIVSQI